MNRIYFTDAQAASLGIEPAEHFPYWKHAGSEHYCSQFELEAYLQRLQSDAEEKKKTLDDAEVDRLAAAERERVEREAAEGANHG